MARIKEMSGEIKEWGRERSIYNKNIKEIRNKYYLIINDRNKKKKDIKDKKW